MAKANCFSEAIAFVEKRIAVKNSNRGSTANEVYRMEGYCRALPVRH
jgi:hypothetical protein